MASRRGKRTGILNCAAAKITVVGAMSQEVSNAAAPLVCIAALYQFARFDDPAASREPLDQACRENGVKGTLLLASEGINGTIAGPDQGIARVLDHIRTLPGCAQIEVKFSGAAKMPFHRLKVRVNARL